MPETKDIFYYQSGGDEVNPFKTFKGDF